MSSENSFDGREITNHTVVVTGFLMLITFMSVIVGGLGLMTTLSLNILERTREIGIMRAIGASTNALLKIILAEGALIGGLSWLLAAGLVIPFSLILDRVLGQALFATPLDFVLNPCGDLGFGWGS